MQGGAQPTIIHQCVERESPVICDVPRLLPRRVCMGDLSVSIDDFGPWPVQQPASVEELCGVVRRAGAAQQSLYPFGGRTMLALGNSPARAGLAVDLRKLDQVIDFPARDMTITVETGITIARLQAIVAAEKLRLPVDVPRPEQATLGGILATNTSGS